jgi:hypothetical protein
MCTFQAMAGPPDNGCFFQLLLLYWQGVIADDNARQINF